MLIRSRREKQLPSVDVAQISFLPNLVIFATMKLDIEKNFLLFYNLCCCQGELKEGRTEKDKKRLEKTKINKNQMSGYGRSHLRPIAKEIEYSMVEILFDCMRICCEFLSSQMEK